MIVDFKEQSVDLSLSNRDININAGLRNYVNLNLDCKEININMKLNRGIGTNISIESIAEPEQIKELTGSLPISFRTTTDAPLIDWSIRGAAGGVGKIGINYLKQAEHTMSDGTYGIQTYWHNGWIASRAGTINSGTADTIGFNFHHSDNSNITPEEVGTMYIVESGKDPETEGVALDIFQGGVTHSGDYNPTFWVLRYGDDGSGEMVNYNVPASQSTYIPIRCGTAIYRLKPNTEYRFTRVGGDEDVEIHYALAKNSANLDINWGNISGLNSIPGNSAPKKSVEQWTRISGYNYYWNGSSSYDILDSRPATYEYCSSFAELKAGRYKVVAECYGNANGWSRSHIYGDQTPYMALISEDNIPIIQKTTIFQGSGKWHHEEYEFTLTADTKVGLYFKGVDKYGYGNVVRFGIFDYDVQAEQFAVQDGQGTLSGVSCWKPYHVTLPLCIQCGDQSATVTIDLGTDLLYASDSIDYATSQTTIPTFVGVNTITVDSDIQPSEGHIKYRKF